jgi:hypothetical protein
MMRLPENSRPIHLCGPAPGERGAMALLVGFSLVMAVVFFSFVVLSGFLVNSAETMRNFSDSWAATQGVQMLLQPQQFWKNGVTAANQKILGQNNAIGPNFGEPTVEPFFDYPNAVSYKNQLDAYAPAYYYHRVSAPWNTGLSGLAQTLLGASVKEPLFAKSAVRLKQANLGNFTIFRQRVMLMMDFSTTMRLNYTGPNGSGQTAKEALQNVASTLIKQSTNLYDLGILGFNDGTNDTNLVVAPPNQRSDVDETAHRLNLLNQVESWSTGGNGTNIENAVSNAAQKLDDARDKDFVFQKPMMIIITDGEPNVSKNVPINSGKDLVTAQEIAAKDATKEMEGQWAKKNGKFPDNVDSLIFQIQRDQAAGLKEEDTAFLSGMAGIGGKANTKNFYQDGGDPKTITTVLQLIPKYPYCQMTALSDPTILGNRRDLWPNGQLDTIRAYVSADAGSTEELAIPAYNTFVDDQIDQFITWSQDPKNAAYLTTAQDGAQNVAQDWLTKKNAGEVLGVYLDTRSPTPYLIASPMLCAALASDRNVNAAPGNAVRIRLRWGYPTVADPAKLNLR